MTKVLSTQELLINIRVAFAAHHTGRTINGEPPAVHLLALIERSVLTARIEELEFIARAFNDKYARTDFSHEKVMDFARDMSRHQEKLKAQLKGLSEEVIDDQTQSRAVN